MGLPGKPRALSRACREHTQGCVPRFPGTARTLPGAGLTSPETQAGRHGWGPHRTAASTCPPSALSPSSRGGLPGGVRTGSAWAVCAHADPARLAFLRQPLSPAPALLAPCSNLRHPPGDLRGSEGPGAPPGSPRGGRQPSRRLGAVGLAWGCSSVGFLLPAWTPRGGGATEAPSSPGGTKPPHSLRQLCAEARGLLPRVAGSSSPCCGRLEPLGSSRGPHERTCGGPQSIRRIWAASPGGGETGSAVKY